jgi:hypothetical protein
MSYTEAKYVKDVFLSTNIGIDVKISGITSFVPLDPANTDYAAIMALVEADELTIAPAEEPPE